MAEGHAAGGSIQLAELIDKYGEHIYRDLHEYAGGLNLVEALREGSGYSPRQIILLIRGLPLESATMAATRGSHEFRGWSVDRYLLVRLIDEVQQLTYAFISANSKKKVDPPEAMYRPQDKPKLVKKERDTSNPFFQRLAAAKKAKAARKAQGA